MQLEWSENHHTGNLISAYRSCCNGPTTCTTYTLERTAMERPDGIREAKLETSQRGPSWLEGLWRHWARDYSEVEQKGEAGLDDWGRLTFLVASSSGGTCLEVSCKSTDGPEAMQMTQNQGALQRGGSWTPQRKQHEIWRMQQQLGNNWGCTSLQRYRDH